MRGTRRIRNDRPRPLQREFPAIGRPDLTAGALTPLFATASASRTVSAEPDSVVHPAASEFRRSSLQ